MLKITSSELRKRMGEALVAVQSDTIQILRHGRPMAFLLSVEDYEKYSDAMDVTEGWFTRPNRFARYEDRLACALAQAACRTGVTVLYRRLPRLFDELELAHGDGRFPRLFRSLTKTQLLILDDWGPDRLTASQRRDLMEIVEDRYGAGPTLITSQLPLSTWHDVIGEPTFADAILDRIVHNAYRLELSGQSLRKTMAKTGDENCQR